VASHVRNDRNIEKQTKRGCLCSYYNYSCRIVRVVGKATWQWAY